MQVIPQQHNRQVPSSPMKELPSTPVASAVVGDEPATSTAATAAAASGPSSSMMESIFVPSDTELTLLCWDYLRQSTNAAMRQKQQEHAAAVDGQEYAPPPTSVSLADQYKTIATWALYQSLLVEAENSETADSSSAPSPEDEIVDTSTLPPLEDMQESLARYQASISLLHPTMTATTTTTGDFDENKESKEPDEGVGLGVVVSATATLEHNDTMEGGANVNANANAINANANACWDNEALLEDDLLWTPHRLFRDGGLGPASTHHVPLGQAVTAGLLVLQAKSRRAAEQDFCQTPLFAHFVSAVQAKGFFETSVANSSSNSNPAVEGAENNAATENANDNTADAIFQDRFRKVVTKFRHKLNHHQYCPPPLSLDNEGSGSSNSNNNTATSTTAAAVLDTYQYAALTAYQMHKQQQQYRHGNNDAQLQSSLPVLSSTQQRQELVIAGLPIPAAYISQRPILRPAVVDEAVIEGSSSILMTPMGASTPRTMSTPTSSGQHGIVQHSQQTAGHPDDLAEAEAFKHTGNTHMQRQEYQLAWDCYTAALLRSPSGPQSHVYFANRAAAAVSLQHWSDAIQDAERSLQLQPDYSKAHARLGLAHFLQGHYRHAVQAYTAALKYEPDNASSRHYLQKAAQRLAAEEQQQQAHSTIASSSNMSSSPAPPPPPPLLPPATAASSSFGETGPPNANDAAVVRQIPSNSSWSSRGGGGGGADSVTQTDKQRLTTEEREAEKFKSQGNALMSQRDYTGALEAYTKALTVCPAGPQSHVYYANRAAAYCYLERYTDARDDAVAALQLQPTYGKAHARLGLALFCARDYVGAVEAYETALEFDPHNTAAQSYLVKAQAKVAKQQAAAASAAAGASTPSKQARTPSRSHQRQEH